MIKPDEKLLQELNRGLLTHGYPMNSDFQLVDSHYDDLMSFEISAENCKSFLIFSKQGDGTLFAIWKKTKDENPIVMFGSEGLVKIVASNLRQFLSLIGSGVSDFHTAYYLPSESSSEDSSNWFCKFLKANNISIDLTRDAMVPEMSQYEKMESELLFNFFECVQIGTDYNQFYITNDLMADVPTQITDNDISRGYMKFKDGFTVFHDDSDLFTVRVRLIREEWTDTYPDLLKPLLDENLHVKTGNLFIFGVTTDRASVQPFKFEIGSYRLVVMDMSDKYQKLFFVYITP